MSAETSPCTPSPCTQPMTGDRALAILNQLGWGTQRFCSLNLTPEQLAVLCEARLVNIKLSDEEIITEGLTQWIKCERLRATCRKLAPDSGPTQVGTDRDQAAERADRETVIAGLGMCGLPRIESPFENPPEVCE